MRSTGAVADEFLRTGLVALDGTLAPPAATCPLRPQLSSARIAREFTALTLRDWDLLYLYDDLVTVSSELVTNALRHALRLGDNGRPDRPARRLPAAWDPRWPVELTLLRNDGEVMCVVNDPSRRAPTLIAAPPPAEYGRGLQVVASLSAEWGWTPLARAGRPAGKAVWALLRS